jgi:HD superfamily phosphohydrolase
LHVDSSREGREGDDVARRYRQQKVRRSSEVIMAGDKEEKKEEEKASQPVEMVEIVMPSGKKVKLPADSPAVRALGRAEAESSAEMFKTARSEFLKDASAAALDEMSDDAVDALDGMALIVPIGESKGDGPTEPMLVETYKVKILNRRPPKEKAEKAE